MTWDYMTVTLGGGDELYTALVSVTVGTTGGDWKRLWEGEVEEYVGGHRKTVPQTRRASILPLYPMGTISGTSSHTLHDKYDTLFCVLTQEKVWIVDCSTSDPMRALVSAYFPQEVSVSSISEELNNRTASKRITLNLEFVDPD